MFFCAISGVVPTDPVVARPSGNVYERRLIEKYIAENGTDPITGGKLEADDIIAVKASEFSSRFFSLQRMKCYQPNYQLEAVAEPLATILLQFLIHVVSFDLSRTNIISQIRRAPHQDLQTLLRFPQS